VQRRQRAEPTDDLCFLPFEGDERLSVILSKALLLAADRQIEDVSIRSQILGPADAHPPRIREFEIP
jgi:hypothetical protein